MPTRLYLAVVDDGTKSYRVGSHYTSTLNCVTSDLQVTLKERQMTSGAAAGQDLETVFSLSPVIQEADVILFESYARIKHLATRTWLHLDRGE